MLSQHCVVPHGFVSISNHRTEQPNSLSPFNHHRCPVFMNKIDDCQRPNAHQNNSFSPQIRYCRYDITGEMREIHWITARWQMRHSLESVVQLINQELTDKNFIILFLTNTFRWLSRSNICSAVFNDTMICTYMYSSCIYVFYRYLFW